MNDLTECIIMKYINNILLKHMSKMNHYQVYKWKSIVNQVYK